MSSKNKDQVEEDMKAILDAFIK